MFLKKSFVQVGEWFEKLLPESLTTQVPRRQSIFDSGDNLTAYLDSTVETSREASGEWEAAETATGQTSSKTGSICERWQSKADPAEPPEMSESLFPGRTSEKVSLPK